MTDLEKIYNGLSSRLRKKVTNRISVADFNNGFCTVQMTLFNSLFDKSSQSAYQQDFLKDFKKTACVDLKKSGKFLLAKFPEDYGHLDHVYHMYNDKHVASKGVLTNALAFNESSPVRESNLDRGIAYHIREANGLRVYPQDAESVFIDYYCCPKDVELVSEVVKTEKGSYEKIVEKSGISMWPKTALPILESLVLEYLSSSMEASNMRNLANDGITREFPSQ